MTSSESYDVITPEAIVLVKPNFTFHEVTPCCVKTLRVGNALGNIFLIHSLTYNFINWIFQDPTLLRRY